MCEGGAMKGKNIWKQRACLCLLAFLTGLPGLAGASGRDEVYNPKLDTLYAMIQGAAAMIPLEKNGMT